jgi:CDP-diacylglycerol--glycerol-3-phosphate 3-phosphatidyltransferase
MNLPNKITTFRMICVVIIDLILLFPFQKLGINLPIIFGNCTLDLFISAILFLVASFSDFLDGYLARKYHLVTTYGKFMDPIADKLLVDTLFIILACRNPELVPPFVCVIIIARDLLVDALRQLASSKGVILAANMWGKAKTVTQMVALTFVLLQDFPFSYINYGNFPYRVTTFICILAMIISAISGILYFTKNLHVFKDKEGK